MHLSVKYRKFIDTSRIPAFAVTRCTYPRRDGQAELSQVAVYQDGYSHTNIYIFIHQVMVAS